MFDKELTCDIISEQMSLNQPPPHVEASFGFMGAIGVIINIVFFIMDIISDGMLAFVLYRQAEKATTEHNKDAAMTWFIITICIIIIPMVILNIFSLLWYWQNKVCLGDYCVLHKMSTSQVVMRVFIHIILLGPLIRYIDIIRYGVKMQREVKEVEMGESGAILRRTPKGEVHAVLQMVISRDTSMLDMMHSFLQDAPQLIFQIYLLYRSPEMIIGYNESMDSLTIAVQVWKVFLGVMAISWSLVSYQDELRRSIPKEKLSCGASVVCLFWRATMIASRVIAIATFASIYQDDDDSTALFTLPKRNNEGEVIVSFPIITAIALVLHWLLMTAWIHAQSTNFCASEQGARRPVLELFYNSVMGAVHIFCYINLKDTPSRRRMVFFYALTLIENTAMITVWYIIMEVRYDLWILITMIFSVEALWVLGICSVIGYYAFLHPDRDHLGSSRNQASWRN
ncbi:XK-related protein 9-like isoform X2 [Macrobrachium rosenbergii]|uniref:XK-related protein 9-like isoform X2 n=1 Tax=Macrobrachium rosenbergii TaxID=79674 RepID=UPI0034D5C3EC